MLSAQIEIVPTLQMPQEEPLKTGAERRKRKRGMFAVPVQICGGVGTLEAFEDLVTTLDVARDGLLLATSRGGYSVGERLQVAFPYWRKPTASNGPRSAQVIRNALLPNFTYARALQFLLGACEGGSPGATGVTLPEPGACALRRLGSNCCTRTVRSTGKRRLPGCRGPHGTRGARHSA